MTRSGNKGEWSELYVFLKILTEKRLYSADESLTLLPESFIKVLSVIRREGTEDLIFEIDHEKDQIFVKKNHEILSIIPIYKINSKLSIILDKMKRGGLSKGAFVLPEADVIMEELHCTKLTAYSSKKTDISLKIEDPNTGTQPVLGFSIKSKIGGLSTLLNASGATNFEFEIIKTNECRNADFKPMIGLQNILSKDECLRFVDVPNKVFRRNLSMIDSHMPEIMGELIKAYYLGLGLALDDLIAHVVKLDPLKVGGHENFYEYKIKELLSAVAFGMQPSKPWTGSYETHGGYIIVKKNGELACYHLYNRDKFKSFLCQNTKLETPSTSRHKFGQIYERDGKKFILLNLQIRFKN